VISTEVSRGPSRWACGASAATAAWSTAEPISPPTVLPIRARTGPPSAPPSAVPAADSSSVASWEKLRGFDLFAFRGHVPPPDTGADRHPPASRPDVVPVTEIKKDAAAPVFLREISRIFR
jgi:hypothetical protein